MDSDDRKLQIAEENIRRLGCENITFIKRDILNIVEMKADRILLDAPCSGLGVIRRKPDIKWNREREDVSVRMPALQLKLLESASRHLKIGGILVYSTCSSETDEGEEVVKRFIEKHGNFEAIPVSIKEPIFNKRYLRTYPHELGIDGFFAARLKRKE